jgi:hypothetical protein
LSLAAVAAVFIAFVPASEAYAAEAIARTIPVERSPVYHIPVRVHLGKSGKKPEEFRPVLEEINAIWLSQAGVCFEIQVVETDDRRADGMDLWFMPLLSGGMWLNGYYRNDHDIQVRNRPELGPADHPAHHPAARTAAHELGHGLGLQHRQDSDDNLMRSRTYGWQLNEDEVMQARETAKRKALPGVTERHCGPAVP